MLFNSYGFVLLYLPGTLAGFFLIARRSHTAAALWLALASLAFYGVWDWRFVPLLAGSILFNFAIGQCIASAGEAGRRRVWLTLGVVGDLAVLGFFKYANFFLASAAAVTGKPAPVLAIVLPLGISFFTFTQIAYLVDVQRGIAREYRFVHYLLFVTYFPHLIAGPVLHHKQMMPQFAHAATYRTDAGNLFIGLLIFTMGLAKKVLIADEFAAMATPVFEAAGQGLPGTALAWKGALAYTLQIYFDFSGYSDMAVGLSKLFNVDLPVNFNSPYKSRNIIEFWRRWHMTLSAFLRDYLYIPLGGNRRGPVRRYVNLFLTMLLGGLWHGAGWTFVLWGALHGSYLIANHLWQARQPAGTTRGADWFAQALTLLAVIVAWVLFRAADIETAGRVLRAMAVPGPGMNIAGLEIAWIAGGFAAVFLLPNSMQIAARVRALMEAPPATEAQRWGLRLVPVAAAGVAYACLISLGQPSPFIYFQF